MPTQNNFLKIIGPLTKDLEKHGLIPILVGGMALVVLGSQRVTHDFDFLISLQDLSAETVLETLYKHGFELISKINERREVLRTIDNPKVAALRLKIDAPPSAYFYHHKAELKIDLLFDFPFPAMEVASRALKIMVRSYPLRVASREDLIRMKEIAYADRRLSTDAQDLEFLRALPPSAK